jgi:hypothetical protein
LTVSIPTTLIVENGSIYSWKRWELQFISTVPNADLRMPSSSSLNVGAGDGLTIEGWINPNQVEQQQRWLNGAARIFQTHFLD